MTFTLDQNLILLREGLDNAFNIILSNPAIRTDPLLDLAEFDVVKRLTKHYNLEVLWPAFRKWKGARRFKSGQEVDFTISNEPYESSFSLDKDQADDNDLLQKFVTTMPAKWAKAYLSLQAGLIASLLNNGETNLCWDKQFFFDTDHPLLDNPQGAGGSQQNYWASGMPLTRSNLYTVDQTMRSRKVQSDSDDVLDLMPRILLVPLQLEVTANDIVNTREILDGDGNRVLNWAFQKYLVRTSARLTDPNAWFVADTEFAKPVIVQERRGVTTAQRTKNEDSNVFYSRQYEMGADCRVGAGYGPWQGIAKARA